MCDVPPAGRKDTPDRKEGTTLTHLDDLVAEDGGAQGGDHQPERIIVLHDLGGCGRARERCSMLLSCRPLIACSLHRQRGRKTVLCDLRTRAQIARGRSFIAFSVISMPSLRLGDGYQEADGSSCQANQRSRRDQCRCNLQDALELVGCKVRRALAPPSPGAAAAVFALVGVS